MSNQKSEFSSTRNTRTAVGQCSAWAMSAQKRLVAHCWLHNCTVLIVGWKLVAPGRHVSHGKRDRKCFVRRFLLPLPHLAVCAVAVHQSVVFALKHVAQGWWCQGTRHVCLVWATTQAIRRSCILSGAAKGPANHCTISITALGLFPSSHRHINVSIRAASHGAVSQK